MQESQNDCFQWEYEYIHIKKEVSLPHSVYNTHFLILP
jgi:hypothetical protein